MTSWLPCDLKAKLPNLTDLQSNMQGKMGEVLTPSRGNALFAWSISVDIDLEIPFSKFTKVGTHIWMVTNLIVTYLYNPHFQEIASIN